MQATMDNNYTSTHASTHASTQASTQNSTQARTQGESTETESVTLLILVILLPLLFVAVCTVVFFWKKIKLAILKCVLKCVNKDHLPDKEYEYYDYASDLVKTMWNVRDKTMLTAPIKPLETEIVAGQLLPQQWPIHPDDYKLFLWKYDPLIVAKGVLNENEEIYYEKLKPKPIRVKTKIKVKKRIRKVNAAPTATPTAAQPGALTAVLTAIPTSALTASLHSAPTTAHPSALTAVIAIPTSALTAASLAAPTTGQHAIMSAVPGASPIAAWGLQLDQLAAMQDLENVINPPTFMTRRRSRTRRSVKRSRHPQRIAGAPNIIKDKVSESQTNVTPVEEINIPLINQSSWKGGSKESNSYQSIYPTLV